MPGKVEIVRTSIESWSRGDHDAALAFADAEIEWRNSGAVPDVEPVYSGVEGVKTFWRLWRQPWSSLSLELDRVVQLDPDHLLALVHFDGFGRDGIRVSREFGQLFTFRGEAIVRFESFASWEDALTAAKLEC